MLSSGFPSSEQSQLPNTLVIIYHVDFTEELLNVFIKTKALYSSILVKTTPKIQYASVDIGTMELTRNTRSEEDAWGN